MDTLRRSSLLYQSFLERRKRYKANRPACNHARCQALSRHAFRVVYLTVLSIEVEWSIVVSLIDSSEYELLKRHNTKARYDFERV